MTEVTDSSLSYILVNKGLHLNMLWQFSLPQQRWTVFSLLKQKFHTAWADDHFALTIFSKDKAASANPVHWLEEGICDCPPFSSVFCNCCVK